jgi:hypothetical protein
MLCVATAAAAHTDWYDTVLIHGIEQLGFGSWEMSHMQVAIDCLERWNGIDALGVVLSKYFARGQRPQLLAHTSVGSEVNIKNQHKRTPCCIECQVAQRVDRIARLPSNVYTVSQRRASAIADLSM